MSTPSPRLSQTGPSPASVSGTGPSEDRLRAILARTRVIAMVGLSPNPARPSFGVARYLIGCGLRVILVNPGHAGQTILGQNVYSDLAAIPQDAEVDMVDIFRRPEAVAEIVDAALSTLPDLRTIWMQLGVAHEAAAQKAVARGLDVVQDRCPKIEIPRLFPDGLPQRGAGA